jgi:two-component system cell cycle sensor histidine kinase/response regulator CckA
MAPDSSKSNPPDPPGAAALPKGTETILLVEDQAPVRALIRRVLAPLGYQILEAEDGDRALAVAAAHSGPIDLLLTDVQLGEMNGPVLAQHLVPLRPSMRVLFISGYVDPAALPGTVSRKTAFLAKPFTPETLARKVRQVLDDTR